MHDKQLIKDVPGQLRPYEKCIRYGESFLSNEELLAIIIKTGTNGES
jgi:DNA repair protein RadC